MPAKLEPLHRVKCTYEDCYESFDTEKEMRRHKKRATEDGIHDYCHKCDIDCGNLKAFVLHKITKPKEHRKACRVCGEEFETVSGLKRHTERVRVAQPTRLIALRIARSIRTDFH